MKQALVLAGGPAGIDGQKCRDWGITRLFWEARDPQCTAKLLKDTRAAGIGVGLMRDPGWDSLSAPELAATMSADLTSHGFGATTGPDSCAAMFDMERHSAQYAIDMLQHWRAIRPTRTTLWTLESGQAGWFTKELCDLINSDQHLFVVPQFYLGKPRMYPVDSGWAKDDLVWPRGTDNLMLFRERVVGFYSAEQKIPYGWNGLIYGFNQLPAKPELPL